MKTLEKIYRNGKEAIQVKFGLSQTNHTYFSVTATLGEKRSGRYSDPVDIAGQRFDCYAGGCCHEDILKHWPDMKDIIDLHLCGPTGIPSYAIENGFYNLEGVLGVAKYGHTYTVEKLSKYLRISYNRTEEAVARIRTKEEWKKFVISLLPEWKAQADAVIQKYGLNVPEAKGLDLSNDLLLFSKSLQPV